MGFKISTLWSAPEVNPLNGKARSIPALNPFNLYGRVFHFAWFGFFMAFWSWYAFPPLLTLTIKKDLHLTTAQVANSNILALTATLLVRFCCGPLCDRFGPRKVFAGLLLAGAIPTALAGTVKNATGLIVLRFFIGILGGTFVPCQVWTTGFYDKNVVGTANALTGGFGNAGGGITYFVMPAIFDSLVHNMHYKPSKAWRVAFIVPFILIAVTAVSMLLFCPDTPLGKWEDRNIKTDENIKSHGIVDVPQVSNFGSRKSSISSPSDAKVGHDTKTEGDNEAQLGEVQAAEIAKGEVIAKPTVKEVFRVMLSPHSLALALPYAATFGAELAVNSILGAYYLHNFPKLGQTGSGRWASMFGLLNAVFRPLGGFISDFIYSRTHSVLAKRIWLHFTGIMAGVVLICIGVTDPKVPAHMFGAVVALIAFIAMSNGANFSVVPHVHPFANGVLSGMVGGCGNLGGIIFAIVFRYSGVQYHRAFWIIGIMVAAFNVVVCWIKPFPKSQVGGR